MRNRTSSLITKLNAKQEVAVKKAKEGRAARCMTKAESRTLKSVGRLANGASGVSLKTQPRHPTNVYTYCCGYGLV